MRFGFDHLNAVPPRITKVATKSFLQGQFVFACDLLAHLRELLFVAHQDAEMPCPIGLQFFHLEEGEKLVFAEFEKGVAFAFIQLLEVEDILIKSDCFFHIVHLDRHMITAVDLNAHW